MSLHKIGYNIHIIIYIKYLLKLDGKYFHD